MIGASAVTVYVVLMNRPWVTLLPPPDRTGLSQARRSRHMLHMMPVYQTELPFSSFTSRTVRAWRRSAHARPTRWGAHIAGLLVARCAGTTMSTQTSLWSLDASGPSTRRRSGSSAAGQNTPEPITFRPSLGST